MAYLPPGGFPATAFPALPSNSDNNKLGQFSPYTLPIGIPGQLGFGGRTATHPISGSYQ